jgi:RecA/RadA recombinase
MEPNKVQDSKMDEPTQMGIKQKLLGEYFGKYTANNNRISREGRRMFTLVGINQEREKIGSYGDPTYTPGGRAKGFFCCVDIRLRRGDWIQQGTGNNKEIVGQVVKYKVEKNKTFRRMMTGEFDYYFAENEANVDVYQFDNEKEIIMCAVSWGVIDKKGSWLYIGERGFQGTEKLAEALKQEPETVRDLKDKVLRLVLEKR